MTGKSKVTSMPHYPADEYYKAYVSDDEQLTKEQKKMLQVFPRACASVPGAKLLLAISTPGPERTFNMKARIRDHLLKAKAMAERDDKVFTDRTGPVEEIKERVRRYVVARNAYEEATKPRGFGHARTLRMSDPIMLAYIRTREDLMEVIDHNLAVRADR